MITLRYHIISISAVFLSLGLGIILGGSIGQNWINEKQQTLLLSLEGKYDQAVKSNKDLQEQIQDLSDRIEQSNQEFSALVSTGYLAMLEGKRVGIWAQKKDEEHVITNLLESAGLEVIHVGTDKPAQSLPIIFIGEPYPPWFAEVEENFRLPLDQPRLAPSEQWELLRKIQHVYKENYHEY
ncbi:copper transporter [Ammoniphilus sp. YIM 78166]|uniref:copper transporter n=1 Tax=Ammoniphilus sp. YIM 78166 TaxID=1644106 RepID=UPI00106FA550|nr:copper transporter [Ammoniphilus sp. YIM 78166]